MSGGALAFENGGLSLAHAMALGLTIPQSLLLMAELGTCDPSFHAGIMRQVASLGAQGAKVGRGEPAGAALGAGMRLPRVYGAILASQALELALKAVNGEYQSGLHYVSRTLKRRR